MRKLTAALSLTALCLTASILAFYVEDNAAPEKVRAHQHLIAAEKESCTHASDVFCTHLPLVLIDTAGERIFDHQDGGYCTLSIIDNARTNNHATDAPGLVVAAMIKIRGASSGLFDKKQYKLDFVESAGSTVQVDREVMGMPAESDWVLNGPYLDKSLIRNYIMYNLAGEIMDGWTPNVRFCEVMLNGEYQGLYLMIESVKAGKNRVVLEEQTGFKRGQTSYLVVRERVGQTPTKLDNFGSYTYITNNELGVKFPRPALITPQELNYIERDISAFEKALYSLDYDNVRFGYAKWIDLKSFVDYWVINEFCSNMDAGNLSTYSHKDVRGKLAMGPVWDFNNAFGLYRSVPMDFTMQNQAWYKMLMKDEIFNQMLIDRYRQLRQGILSEENVYGYIDAVVAYLGEAVERNFDVWGYTFQMDLVNEPVRLGYLKNPTSYEEAIRALKDFIHIRGNYLDLHIDTIKQFSAESKVKQYN